MQSKSTVLRSLLLTALFTALTAVGALIRIPLGYTSVTLQVFFMLLAGMLLGPYYGALSQILYILLGLLGVPVFAGGGGFSYVLEPGFGFLLGGVFAAFAAGLVVRGRGSFVRLLLGGLVGLAALYAVGLPYLLCIVRLYLQQPLGFTRAFCVYCLAFLPLDLGKLLLAAVLCRRLRSALV